MAQIVSTRDFNDKKVFRETFSRKNPEQAEAKPIGRVRSCVFHPELNVCVGIMVNRPDAALMFHRPDQFAALDRIYLDDSDVIVTADGDAIDKPAAKRLGLNLDDCVIWNGLAVVTKDKQRLGYVGHVDFDLQTGMVQQVVVYSGAAKDALLGKFVIPAELVKGFRWGIGDVITLNQNDAEGEAQGLCGGLLVDAKARELATQGGVAAAAGKASAVAANEVRKVKVKVKPKIDEGMKVAGAATTKGLYVTGRQLSRTKGMFGAFKDELQKGLKGEK